MITETPDLLQIISTLKDQPSTLIWAEGEEKKQVAGKGRNELVPADVLAIWTIPPSPQELHAAMVNVHPRTVYLFALTDPIESPEVFMGRWLVC